MEELAYFHTLTFQRNYVFADSLCWLIFYVLCSCHDFHFYFIRGKASTSYFSTAFYQAYALSKLCCAAGGLASECFMLFQLLPKQLQWRNLAFQQVSWQSKKSGRNRPQQVRNLGWNLAQELTKIISFYLAPSIQSSVFHLTENISSHQAHSTPPRTSHPTKRILWSHPNKNISFHRAYLIPPGAFHTTKNHHEHLVPPSASHSVERILSHQEPLIPPSASHLSERIPSHREHLNISSHWAHPISLVCFFPRCLYLTPGSYCSAFHFIAVLYNTSHPTANISEDPNQEFKIIHVQCGDFLWR